MALELPGALVCPGHEGQGEAFRDRASQAMGLMMRGMAGCPPVPSWVPEKCFFPEFLPSCGSSLQAEKKWEQPHTAEGHWIHVRHPDGDEFYHNNVRGERDVTWFDRWLERMRIFS